MIKVVFIGWKKGMQPLPFYKFLYEKTSLTLKEARDIRLKITEGIVVSIDVEDIDQANEIKTKSEEFGVLVDILFPNAE